MRRSVALIGSVGVLLTAAVTHAAWRVEIESKTVQPGQTWVTADITVAWEEAIAGLTIPVVVREIDAGSFWTDTLPRYMPQAHQGVSWHSTVVSWPVSFRQLIPGPFPGLPCHTDADTNHYDGLSPDYFSINAVAFNPLPPNPSGLAFLTITFDVTTYPGQFEFDTACFAHGQDRIYLVDAGGQNVSHPIDFVKGVITIAAQVCDCPHQGDCSNNGVVSVVDLVYLVEYAFAGTIPMLPTDPLCPRNRGDWNCDGRNNLADVAAMARYLFRDPHAPGPCNPCGE